MNHDISGGGSVDFTLTSDYNVYQIIYPEDGLI